MVRVNLFESAGPGIYGTATGKDILTICGAAALFCLAMVLISYGVVRVLEAIK
jgi:hypothetical protein